MSETRLYRPAAHCPVCRRAPPLKIPAAERDRARQAPPEELRGTWQCCGVIIRLTAAAYARAA